MNARMEKHLERVKFLREAEAAAGDLESRIAFCKAFLEKHEPKPKPQAPVENDLLDEKYKEMMREFLIKYPDIDYGFSRRPPENNLLQPYNNANNVIQGYDSNTWSIHPITVPNPITQRFRASFTIPEELYGSNRSSAELEFEIEHGVRQAMMEMIGPLMKAGCMDLNTHIDHLSYNRINTLSLEAVILRKP